jgi:hypothetical protein
VKSHALGPFWRCDDELPGHVQRLARKNFELFKANPRHPSLGFQKKGGVYTVEVGRSYRAIARERDGEYLLVLDRNARRVQSLEVLIKIIRSYSAEILRLTLLFLSSAEHRVFSDRAAEERARQDIKEVAS